MNQPKLLIATTVPEMLYGFMLPFARHFRAQGWRVDALARGVTASAECVKAFDRVWEMPWSRNPLHPANFLSVPKRLRELVQCQDYDIVHVHSPVAGFVTRLALRQMRQRGRPRVIYTAHGFHFYRGGPRLRGALYRTLERWAGRWTDYLVVINREDEQAALQFGLVPPERLRAMPGIGVDRRQYSAAAVSAADIERVHHDLGLSPSDRLLLMIAEFIPRKRHRDVLQAMALLNRPDAVLALAGVGPLLGPMQQLAANLGVAQRVRFLGFRTDVPALLQASVANLLPSEQEGLPRSVMEAMCQGIPVIGSRIRGTTDLLDDGCGLLTPVGNAQAIADAMAWVLDHPDQARSLADRARTKMANYDLDCILKLHEDLYQDALCGQQAAPRHHDHVLTSEVLP